MLPRSDPRGKSETISLPSGATREASMTFPLASAVLRLFRRRRRTFSTRTINGTWLVFAGPLVGIDEENLARRHPRHKGLASATVHEGSRGWTAAPRSDLLPASLLLSSTLTHPHQFYRDRNLQIDWSDPPPLTTRWNKNLRARPGCCVSDGFWLSLALACPGFLRQCDLSYRRVASP